MVIGNRMHRKAHRTQKAGAMITGSALAKAVAQLELARSSASLCDPELAKGLADILARLAALQRELAGRAW